MDGLRHLGFAGNRTNYQPQEKQNRILHFSSPSLVVQQLRLTFGVTTPQFLPLQTTRFLAAKAMGRPQ
jgi:queuine/archaeosine tRNA-ribosyltransferase